MLAGTTNLKNGFYIEAGAWDGVYLTNTLLFELREGGVMVDFEFHKILINHHV